MAIDRTNYNLLTDDDGSNTVGTVWTKNIVKTVLLDPMDSRWAESTTTATGNQDNLAYSEADILRCNNATTITLRGLLAPAAPLKPGKMLLVVSVGAGTVVLNDQDANSTAANRLITGTAAALTLAAGTGYAVLEYDSVTARWRVLGSSASLDAKAPLASPTLTGTPAAPTAAVGTNTTQLATTAFALANWPGGVVGNLSFPATQVPSAGANVLDDYEEGTWTPIDSSGASLSLTSNWPALYTKIGRVVYVVFGITYPATASGATATLGGLPFTSGGGGGQQYSLVTTYSDYGAGMLNFIAGAGTTIAFFSLAAVALTNANLSGKTIRASGFYFV